MNPRRLFRPVCRLFGHRPAPCRMRSPYGIWTGWACRRCGQYGLRLEARDLDPESDLRLRSALEQFEAKLNRDGGSLTWRTREVDEEESAP